MTASVLSIDYTKAWWSDYIHKTIYIKTYSRKYIIV